MAGKKAQTFNLTRQRLHEVIFEADTPAGKLFDVVLKVLNFVIVIVVV